MVSQKTKKLPTSDGFITPIEDHFSVRGTLSDKNTDRVEYTDIPLNAGTPLQRQRQSFLTPNALFFVRNHALIPEVDVNTYRLSIDGMVKKTLSLSLFDLQKDFASRTVTSTLICAGYRRHELEAIAPIPNEVPWQADPISTANWRGVPLQEVLEAAGLRSGAAHIAFLGMDEAQGDGNPSGFGASIPIEKALSPEVLLAYEMNGEPLPPEHGYPPRVIVPGYIGARSVKWLANITVQAEPSTNYYQSRAYKLFQPHDRPERVDWEQGRVLEELPVNSVICEPADRACLKPGLTLIRGIAIGSGGRRVEKVEVSCDQGATWKHAQIAQENDWAWCFWQVWMDLAPGTYQFMVRAFDCAGYSQPE